MFGNGSLQVIVWASSRWTWSSGILCKIIKVT